MALSTTTGTELALAPNAATGKLRLTWSNGDAAFDDRMLETIMSLLFESEGPFTTNRRRGPGPMSIAVDLADAPALMKARAEERLQLAIEDGRLKSAVVTVERKSRGSLALMVQYETRAGRRDMVTVPIGS